MGRASRTLETGVGLKVKVKGEWMDHTSVDDGP